MSQLIDVLPGRLRFAPLWMAMDWFDGHSAPMVLIAILGLAGIVALVALYRRKRQLQGMVDEQFQSFRSKAVSLMDQLDRLRKRHKELPETDPDFKTPMTGATLALYKQVDADLNRLWEHWLRVMEVWDEAQRRLRDGTGLAVKPTEEARRLLEQNDVDALLRESATSKERLDHLNLAHEQARGDLVAAREELAVARRMAGNDIEHGGRLTSQIPSQDIRTAEALITSVEQTLEADPIGAELLIARARQDLLAPEDRAERQPRRPLEKVPGSDLFNDLAAAADKFRSVVAKLVFTDILRFMVRAWIAVWLITLLFGLLTTLVPIALFVLAFLLFPMVFWGFWQLLTSWFWFGLWRIK